MRNAGWDGDDAAAGAAAGRQSHRHCARQPLVCLTGEGRNEKRGVGPVAQSASSRVSATTTDGSGAIDLRASRDADLLPNPTPKFSFLLSPCEATGGCRRHGGDPSDGLGVIDARARPRR